MRREYSNISLTHVLEINAPRGQIWELINIREVERKSTMKSREICSGGLTGRGDERLRRAAHRPSALGRTLVIII